MKTYYSNINNFKESTQGMSSLEFEERYSSYLLRISEPMKKHILRFKYEDDRLRSLAGYMLVLDAVKSLKEKCKDETYKKLSNISFPIKIDYEASGKPFLLDAPEISFSISHSGSYAAIVIASSDECNSIGIDIQAKDRFDVLKIAKRFYTDNENALINCANTDSDKEDLFYKIWSAKEAFVKCDGKGLSYGISNFNADIAKGIITDLKGNTLASIYEQQCPDGYVCYVCTK